MQSLDGDMYLEGGGVLAMSRAFGNCLLKQFVVAKPEIQKPATLEDGTNNMTLLGMTIGLPIPHLRIGTRKPHSLLKFVTCGRCLHTRSRRYVSNFVKKSERNAPQGKLKCNNLYIKNLDPEFTDGHLHEIFSLYGKVNSAVVMKNELGRSRGFGFVSFFSQEHALKAMVAMSGSKLGSKTIYVGLAQKKTVRQELMKLQFGKWGTQNPKKLQGESVYVKYLDFSVDDKKLQEYFAECGTITSAKIMRDAHGQSMGFGFVCFSSPEEAKIAIKTFNGTMLHGKQLYVGMPKCKEDRHKDLLFQFPKAQSTTCIETYCSPYYSQLQNPIFMHQLCGMFSNQCKQVDIATNAIWGNKVQHVNVPLQYPPFVPVYPLPGLYCTQMTKYENYGGHSINSYFGGVKQYGNSKKVKGIYYPRFNVSNPCDSPRRMKKTCRSAYLCSRT